MKKLLFLLLIITVSVLLSAQDIDFYHNQTNSYFKMPEINNQMSFSEFQLLSQTFRIQDMLYATVVPGYIHFKAQDNLAGIVLIIVRSGSLYLANYEIKWLNQYLKDSTVRVLFNPSYANTYNENVKKHKKIAEDALMVALSTYVFDIIHGKYRLEKKQQAIRYKYSLKASLSYQPYPFSSDHYSYGIKLSLNF